MELYVSDIKNITTEVQGNLTGGQVKVEKMELEKEVSKFKLLSHSIINLFGLKWIPIIILIVMFLLSLLKTFMVILDEFELTLLDLTFGTLFIISDIVLLIVLIGVIEY